LAWVCLPKTAIEKATNAFSENLRENYFDSRRQCCLLLEDTIFERISTTNLYMRYRQRRPSPILHSGPVKRKNNTKQTQKLSAAPLWRLGVFLLISSFVFGKTEKMITDNFTIFVGGCTTFSFSIFGLGNTCQWININKYFKPIFWECHRLR
jgi:hypothetical protein